MVHVDSDELTLAALGVAPLAPVEAGHLRSCADCATALVQLQGTVQAARGHDPDPAPEVAPSAQVWQAITAELGLPSGRQQRPVATWGRRLALAAAAVLIAVASAGVGAALGDRGGQSPTAQSTGPGGGSQQPTVLARADLLPLTADLAGSARWVAGARGSVLEVEISGAPGPAGYLEVWLLDPDSLRMVSLGALRAGVPANLTVPDGIAVSDYPAVDVSAEPLDDDPTHSGISVARGALQPSD